MNWKPWDKPPKVTHVTLTHLPADVAHYLTRKAVNSDGARALLTKYGHPLPEDLGRRTAAPTRMAELSLAVEPCPECLSLDTRPLAGKVLVHGKQAWFCNTCEHRWGIGEVRHPERVW